MLVLLPFLLRLSIFFRGKLDRSNPLQKYIFLFLFLLRFCVCDFLYEILLVKHCLRSTTTKKVYMHIFVPKFLRNVSIYFGILAFNNYIGSESSTVVNMYIILEFLYMTIASFLSAKHGLSSRTRPSRSGRCLGFECESDIPCAGVDRICSQVAVFARIDGGCWLWWRYVRWSMQVYSKY